MDGTTDGTDWRVATLVDNWTALRQVLSGYASRRTPVDDLIQAFAEELLSQRPRQVAANPLAYVVKAARNFGNDSRRKDRAAPREFQFDLLPCDALLCVHEPESVVLMAVQQLSEPHRTTVRLRYAGLTVREIAAAVRCGKSTVARRLEEGGQVLREVLRG